MKQTLQAALDARGYDTLTPVQEAVLAPELEGRDLLVSAQTGSGKTLGFGMAIAPTILADADVFGPADAPLALVIAPTRELAMQVKRELAWLFEKAGVVMASCVGGMDMRDERRSLARGAHIVVATPGRLRDHLMRESIDLSAARAVVLDEADEMLDLGFREDLEFILSAAPEDRQTLLFSATVSKPIARIAETYQRDAQRIVTKSEAKQHADITYRAMVVAEQDSDNAVINTLRFYESPNAIVFANTRAAVNRLTTRLSNRGFQVVCLSGELSQAERSHALQAMRDGRAQVCVATDVAARGIDLPNLDLVIHAELPNAHESLLHRSGRTGRAGRKGVSALVVTKKSRRKAERILTQAKLDADWGNAPSADEVRAEDEARLLADPAWNADVPESARSTVDMLAAQFTPQQLAAGYLALFHTMRTAPEELRDADAKPAPRAEFGASVWYSLSIGREDDAEPRVLLPMLCKAGDLTKDDIGAIRVRSGESFVQIKETSVPGFEASIGSEGKIEGGVTAKRLAGAPDLGDDRPPRPHRKSSGGPKPRYQDGPKPAYKDRPKPAYKDGTKPSYKDKPTYSDGPKPAPRKPRNDAAPIDYNDAPTPRVKKPKPGDASAPRKPRHNAADSSRRMDDAIRTGAVKTPRKDGPAKGKPSGKPYTKSGGKPYTKPAGERPSTDGPKGPPPPKGKKNSKKNKARAAAKSAAIGKGGNAAPKRPKG